MSLLDPKKNLPRPKLPYRIDVTEGFVTSFDGTKIHYRTSGHGLPIVCCNGIGVTSLFWKYFENFFRKTHQIIIWDYRGHNQSELPQNIEHATVDAVIKDCKAVLDALHIKKAIFLGFSIGTQVALEFIKKYPEKMIGLILCLGTYGRPMDTFYNTPLSKPIYQGLSLLGRLFPAQANQISRFLLKNPFWYELGGFLKMINPHLAQKEDACIYVDHLLDVDPIFFSHLLESFQEHSTEDILKKIKVPTLIIGAEHDRFTPVWISKKMHRSIPKSELFIVKRSTHAALLEQPELINLRIEKFLKEQISHQA